MIIITYNNFIILVIMGLKMNQRNSEKSGGGQVSCDLGMLKGKDAQAGVLLCLL